MIGAIFVISMGIAFTLVAIPIVAFISYTIKSVRK